MRRIKTLLEESTEAAADQRHTHGEHGRIDRDEGAETPRIRESTRPDDSSTTWSEVSDATSMPYTVRSITSCNEQTRWPFWLRNDAEMTDG
jgi:hypothetical protein